MRRSLPDTFAYIGVKSGFLLKHCLKEYQMSIYDESRSMRRRHSSSSSRSRGWESRISADDVRRCTIKYQSVVSFLMDIMARHYPSSRPTAAHFNSAGVLMKCAQGEVEEQTH